ADRRARAADIPHSQQVGILLGEEPRQFRRDDAGATVPGQAAEEVVLRGVEPVRVQRDVRDGPGSAATRLVRLERRGSEERAAAAAGPAGVGTPALRPAGPGDLDDEQL